LPDAARRRHFLLGFFCAIALSLTPNHLPMSDLAHTAFLTGSNRGLGLEFARRLAPRVTQLFATCRHPDTADALQTLADAHADTVHVLALDVAEPDRIQSVLDAVRDAAPEGIDLLINNAGINGGGRDDTFGTVDAETMTRTLRVNAVGPHLLAQEATGLLQQAADAGRTPRVVNITSQLGSIARTSGGTWQSYKASKAALNMCTRLQAGAFASMGGLAVALHPGWVQTDMGGSNARLTPETSVAGMLDVIENLTAEDNGRFLTYSGEELPW
jgi:NAD(P)-dependent dehydrogenase (short-subunit alcohol dehydrogenase family)